MHSPLHSSPSKAADSAGVCRPRRGVHPTGRHRLEEPGAIGLQHAGWRGARVCRCGWFLQHGACVQSTVAPLGGRGAPNERWLQWCAQASHLLRSIPMSRLYARFPAPSRAPNRHTQNRRRRLQAGATLTAAVTWRASDASAGAAVASDATQCCPFKAGCPATGVCAGAIASYPVKSAAIRRRACEGWWCTETVGLAFLQNHWLVILFFSCLGARMNVPVLAECNQPPTGARARATPYSPTVVQCDSTCVKGPCDSQTPSCNTATGVCTHTYAANGAACNSASGQGSCKAGVCQGEPRLARPSFLAPAAGSAPQKSRCACAPT
jgi:hypothetical protein